MGVWCNAAKISLFCKLRRSVFSLKQDDRRVSSKINNSHALANNTGASARIIRTSVPQDTDHHRMRKKTWAEGGGTSVSWSSRSPRHRCMKKDTHLRRSSWYVWSLPKANRCGFWNLCWNDTVVPHRPFVRSKSDPIVQSVVGSFLGERAGGLLDRLGSVVKKRKKRKWRGAWVEVFFTFFLAIWLNCVGGTLGDYFQHEPTQRNRICLGGWAGRVWWVLW